MMIAGRSRSGKSYHFEHAVLPELIKNDWRQIWILDMKGQYMFGTCVNLKSIKGMKHMAEIAIGKHSPRGKDGKLRAPRIITIRTPYYSVDEIEMVFAYMNRSANKILVMEEAAFYFEDLKKKTLPDETKYYIRCSTGDHNLNNNMVLITQYPNDVPTPFLNMFNKGRIFYLPPKAIDYLCSKNFIADDRETVLRAVSPLGSWRWYDVEEALYRLGEPDSTEDEEPQERDADRKGSDS